MQQRRTPSWSRTFLLTASLLAITGCGDTPSHTEPQQIKSQSQSRGFGPDLVIREIHGPTSVRMGRPFTTTVRVCNDGTASAHSPVGPVQMDLYLSEDATLSWPTPGQPPPITQLHLSAMQVSPLEPGQCETFAFTTSATPPGAHLDGAYYLGAIVDVQQVLVELDETNNTAVTAMGMGSQPDLVITELLGPKSTRSHEPLSPTVKVCNQGTDTSPPNIVELYLSTNGVLTPSGSGGPPPTHQAILGVVPVPELRPGHCAIRQGTFPMSVPPDAAPGQPLHLGAIVDPFQHATELNETNNTFVGELLGVGDGVDLVVTAIHAPASVREGDPLNAAVRVCNHGTVLAGPTPIDLYLAVDGDVTLPGNGPPPPGQRLVGQTVAPYLNPGQCLTRPIQGAATRPAGAPQHGAVVLAAIVDATNDAPELREDNNIFVQGLIGLGDGPDLVVTAIRAPPTVDAWSPSTQASVTVCNEGTSSSSMATVGLFLSMVPSLDSRFMPTPFHATQAQVGEVMLPSLDAGRCVTRDATLHVNRPQGAPPQLEAFYLGAIVDTWADVEELREDNNVFIGERIGTGNLPDLVITSLKGPATHRRESFPVTARVCNQGSQSSASTQMDFYLTEHGFLNAPVEGGPSPNTDPYTAVFVGMRHVPSLQPGECAPLSATVESAHIPSEYLNRPIHLGAVIDPHRSVEELREDNNTFIGARMGLGERPDLVVTEIQAPPSVRISDALSTTVTVCNQGTTPAQPSVAQVYLSTEPQFLLPDWPGLGNPYPSHQMPAGDLNVPALHAGRCFTGHAHGVVNLPSGAHGEAIYLGAGIDVGATVQELREDNNTLLHGRIGVGDAADLVVTAINAPPSVSRDDAFTATVTLCNQGTSFASNAEVELYLSTQATLEMPRWHGPGAHLPETQWTAGHLHVQDLSPGQCVTRSLMGTATPPPAAMGNQPLYLGAAVDTMGNIAELREDNNTFVSGLMGVGNGPDLVITAVQAPPNVSPSATFSTSVTVCNQGTNTSTSTQVALHLATEERIVLPRWGGPGAPLPSTQQSIGEMNVPSLNVGRCFTGSIVATVMPPPAAIPGQQLYLGAIADSDLTQPELREDNNVFLSGRMAIGNAPDLVVTSLTGPASVGPYSAFTATATVCNQGTLPSPSTNVEIHLSTEAELAMPSTYHPGTPMPDSQAFAGDQPVPPLEVDECITLSVPAISNIPSTAQPNQPLYLGALISPYMPGGELREDNNVFVSGLMGVGNGPDLVITAMQAPVSASLYGNFTAMVTVCNQGTQTSNNTEVGLYFSTQAHIVLPQWNGPGAPHPRTQEFIGSWSVQSLNPGQCVTEPIPASVNLPQEAEPHHPLYLGAAVDTGQSQTELREDNNTFVSGLMGVGNRPDLVVTSLSSPMSVRTGSTFTATVRVCNQGTTSTSGDTNVDLFLSSSSSLEFPYQGGPGGPSEGQVFIGGLTVQHLEPGQCSTRNTSVNAFTPPGSSSIGFFYLGAIVDPWRGLDELREDNNVLADRLIMVMP
ncbi:CARDB domain-containing protein [Comamonas sp. JC664]|uniref:CARDB domain-containing protein n=1 Tax=Comamonas sp. JC664 TaxID=2801917 RepID=UPI00174CF788|nr:CARDB domain-containing protein [Comamonas sp. JC664]